MYILFPNGEIDDPDMEQLQELLAVLDHQFALYSLKRKASVPPGQNLHWDRLSYLAGLGFVMCQQYINVTYPSKEISRDTAFCLPPNHSSGYSIVSLINTSANYWKHYQAYEDYPHGSLHKPTVQIIESLDIDIEYPYINESILERIVETDQAPFCKLAGLLTEWRNNLILNTNKALHGIDGKPASP